MRIYRTGSNYINHLTNLNRQMGVHSPTFLNMRPTSFVNSIVNVRNSTDSNIITNDTSALISPFRPSIISPSNLSNPANPTIRNVLNSLPASDFISPGGASFSCNSFVSKQVHANRETTENSKTETAQELLDNTQLIQTFLPKHPSGPLKPATNFFVALEGHDNSETNVDVDVDLHLCNEPLKLNAPLGPANLNIIEKFESLIQASHKRVEKLNHIKDDENTKMLALLNGSPQKYKEIIIEAAINVIENERIDDSIKRMFIANIKLKLNDVTHDEIRVKAVKFLSKHLGKSKNPSQLLNEQYTTLLGKGDWSEIKTNIVVSIDNKDALYENTLTPLKDITIGEEKKPIVSYGDNLNGISCRINLFEKDHAANIWHTQLNNEYNQTIFSGLRHAVLTSAHEDINIKCETGIKKATELLKAAIIIKHKNKIEDILKNKHVLDTPLNLRLTSTSLMTMTNLKISMLNLNEPEKTMNTDQINALTEAAKQLTSIEINDISIPVKVDVTSFCASINDLALGPFKFINHDAWMHADKINASSLKVLLGSLEKSNPISGWAGDYLKEEQNQEKRAQVELLVNEIRYIFNNKLHHAVADDICKLSTRILLLSHLIGTMPAFNCKSGKDRTAVLDSEVKALAASLHMKAHFPSSLSNNDTALKEKELIPFYLDRANMYVQTVNTGLAGNKSMTYLNRYFLNKLGSENRKIVRGYCMDA